MESFEERLERRPLMSSTSWVELVNNFSRCSETLFEKLFGTLFETLSETLFEKLFGTLFETLSETLFETIFKNLLLVTCK